MSEVIKLQQKCKHVWPHGNVDGMQSCELCGLTRPDPRYTWTATTGRTAPAEGA